MKHGQKAPRKPLFSDEQASIFLSCFGGELEQKIAKYIFVEGVTNEEVADEVGYSKRHIERIRITLMKIALKKLIDKDIPKKPFNRAFDYDADYGHCPNCKQIVSDFHNFKICSNCGQALDWSDTE